MKKVSVILVIAIAFIMAMGCSSVIMRDEQSISITNSRYIDRLVRQWEKELEAEHTPCTVTPYHRYYGEETEEAKSGLYKYKEALDLQSTSTNFFAIKIKKLPYEELVIQIYEIKKE